MNAIDRLRTVASGEWGMAEFDTADCAELLQEIDRLKAALTDADGRASKESKAAITVMCGPGYCDRCNRWSNEISQDKETEADLCDECQFNVEEEREKWP